MKLKGISLSVSVILVISLVLVMAAPLASAGSLISVSATPTDSTAGATTTYTIGFTTATEIPVSGSMEIVFPEGYTLVASPATFTATTISPYVGTFSYAVDTATRTATITLDSENTLAASTAVTVTLSDVTNPATAGTYTITENTYDASKALIDTGTADVTIDPDVLAALSIIDQPTQTVAGVAIGLVTVRAQDQFGNPIEGVAIAVTENSIGYAFDSGTLSQDTNASGIATFSNLVINTAGTGYTLKFENGAVENVSDPFNVIPDVLAAYTVVPAGPYTAGTPFEVTITAVDEFGNPLGDTYITDEPYTWETNAHTAPDGISTPAIGTVGAGDFTDGVATISVTLYCAESGVTFTVTDDSTMTGVSDPITVVPDVLAAYTVVPADLTQTAGAPFDVVITAVDAYENPITTIDATLNTYTFTFTGPADAPNSTAPTYPDMPADFSGGVWSLEVTLVKAETVSLTVTDNQLPTPMTGTSDPITVNPSIVLYNENMEIIGEYYVTIQGAVGAAALDPLPNYIHVPPGIYGPFMVVGDNDLSIIAPEGGVTVGGDYIEYTITINGEESIRSIILVVDSENILIRNIDVDGGGVESAVGVVYLNSTGRFAEGTVSNTQLSIAIASFEVPGTVEISDTIIQNSALGIVVWNDEAKIKNFSITGGQTGIMGQDNARISVLDSTIDSCQMGIMIVDNTILWVDNSEITNSTDGGSGQGIRVGMGSWMEVVRPSTAEIRGSHISGNDSGIIVDNDGSATINFNDIEGNFEIGVLRIGPTPINARWNWWGHESGPHNETTNPEGSGDGVSDNVIYSPWLRESFKVHIWPDVTPSTIENALAMPDMISLISYSYSNWKGYTNTGPYGTSLIAEASDEEGVWSVTLNFRPLFEKMFANVEFEDNVAWQVFLEEMEDVPMYQLEGNIWRFEFWGSSWFWPIDMLDDYGLVEEDEMSRILSQEIQLGDFTIPVTVTDWAGNENCATIELAIVDIMVPLEKGWNLRSTPVTLANARWGDIVSLGSGDSLSYDAALRINVETGEWEVVGENYELKPLEAVYIHATKRDQIGLAFSREPTAPIRRLGEGWNLVGYAPLGYVEWYWDDGEADWSWEDMYVHEAMLSIELTPGGLRGYTAVVSPGEDLSYYEEYEYGFGGYDWDLEQDVWVHTPRPREELNWDYMEPFGGYLVFMDNPDLLAGFSIAPVSWYYYYSCPFLYTWNGDEYTYIADLLAGGILDLGMQPPSPRDYVKIEGSQLQPKDGFYSMQITQEYDEISYLDQLRLTTVDHPSDVNVYPSLIPGGGLGTVSKNPTPPVSAVDEGGIDILQQITSKDNVYTSGRQYALDLLELNLGDLSDAAQIKLVLIAYTNPPDLSEVPVEEAWTHLSQDRFIQVKDASGNWVTIFENRQIAQPSGSPRTYVINLTGKFLTDDYSVRIGFMADVRFDYVAVDTSPQQPIVVNTINPTSADIHFRGYSKLTGTPALPDYYDFTVTPPADYSEPKGDFTRYGDIQPLLTATDDMLVIMHHGDEITVNFESTPVPEGMSRSFFLYVYGYYKTKLYATGGTVEPLPFKGMSTYPYPEDESYPYDDEHTAYLAEYNTRHYD